MSAYQGAPEGDGKRPRLLMPLNVGNYLRIILWGVVFPNEGHEPLKRDFLRMFFVFSFLVIIAIS